MDKNLGGGMESPGRLSIPGTSSLPAGGILEHLGVCCVRQRTWLDGVTLYGVGKV